MLQIAVNVVFRRLNNRVLNTGAAIKPLTEIMVKVVPLADARTLKNVLEIVGSTRCFLVIMSSGNSPVVMVTLAVIVVASIIKFS